jgi:tetratricopeptide (TPR) repeat protein
MTKHFFSVFIVFMFLFSSGCVYRDQITSEGKRLQLAENINASRTTYDQLVIDDPLNATAWCIRGNYYNDAFGQFDEALASYDHALGLDPTHAYCWYSKGVTLQNMGRSGEALTCFENAKKYWFSPGLNGRG